MYNQIGLLVNNDKIYVLGEKSKDTYDLLFPPYNIGKMAIAFANTDLAYLGKLRQFKLAFNQCLSEDELDLVKLQSITMRLIHLLDINAGTFWFFEIERIGLESFERDLVRTIPRKEELSLRIGNILSQLESIIQFQEDLKKVLYELSLADKKASGHASSAQILYRLFREFPAIFNYCYSMGHYVFIDVNECDELRIETLDRNISNAFQSILAPESPPLEYNDIKDNKVLCEFHVVSDVKMCIMYDLVEGLRRSNFFAQCATCKTFFFTSDKRLIYCENKECSSDVSRMRRRKEKIQKEPFLKEAYRYKNVMAARYRRTNDGTNRKETTKSLSHKEYEDWMDLFRKTCNEYEQKKAEAILRGATQKELRKISDEFIVRIRPEGYIPHKKGKEQEPNHKAT